MKRWFWIVILVTIVTRGVTFAYYRPWSASYDMKVMGEDPYVYHRLAIDLLATGQYGGNPEYDSFLHVATVRPPGYPLFVAAVYAVFGIRPWVVLLVHILLSAVSAALLMGAVRTTIGERSAVVAGMLFAVHPVATFTAISMFSETFFLFLLCLLLYVMAFTWQSQQSSAASVLAVAMWLSIGVIAGMSTVVRVSMLYLAPLLILLWIGFSPTPLRQRATCFFAALAGFALPLLPWSLHNYQRFGSYRLSASGEYNLLVLTVGQAFAKGGLAEFERVKRELTAEALQRMRQDGLPPATKPLHRARYYRQLALEKLYRHPRVVLRGCILGAVKFWFLPSRASGESFLGDTRGTTRFLLGGALFYAAALQVLLVTSALYGIHQLWKRRQALWALTLVLAALYFTLGTGAAGSSRYFLQVLPFLLPVSAHGLCRALAVRERQRNQ
ncbi:MAG: glycosyltransferase family 39 protein [Armatimonadota bacterium]|nr:glycosyltransferase family 39 protein [Armatimonadota bacterium]